MALSCCILALFREGNISLNLFWFAKFNLKTFQNGVYFSFEHWLALFSNNIGRFLWNCEISLICFEIRFYIISIFAVYLFSPSCFLKHELDAAEGDINRGRRDAFGVAAQLVLLALSTRRTVALALAHTPFRFTEREVRTITDGCALKYDDVQSRILTKRF